MRFVLISLVFKLLFFEKKSSVVYINRCNIKLKKRKQLCRKLLVFHSPCEFSQDFYFSGKVISFISDGKNCFG